MSYVKLQAIFDNPRRKNKLTLCCDDENEGIYLVDPQGSILGIDETKELILGLQKFVKNVNQDDIDAINSDIESEHRQPTDECLVKNIRPSKPKPQRGVVYFIRDDKGRVKIGKAKNMKYRMGEYTKLPFEPELVHLIESNDYHMTEHKFYVLFAQKRLRGEWFNLTNEDIQMIKKI